MAHLRGAQAAPQAPRSEAPAPRQSPGSSSAAEPGCPAEAAGAPARTTLAGLPAPAASVASRASPSTEATDQPCLPWRGFLGRQPALPAARARPRAAAPAPRVGNCGQSRLGWVFAPPSAGHGSCQGAVGAATGPARPGPRSTGRVTQISGWVWATGRGFDTPDLSSAI